jgi:hypothetical protein
MDPVLMVSARALLPEVIEEGRRLLRAVHESQIDVKAAYWVFLSDLERWRLVIASRIYDRQGPIKTYSRFGAVYDRINPRLRIPITDLELASPEDRLVKVLEKRFIFKREKLDTVIEHVNLDGEYFEALYLYQLSEI